MVVLEWLRYIFGSLFILFIPGFSWSWIFFKKDKIDWIERIALSVGLSVALVPLTILWLNYVFGVKITLLNTILAVCILSALPVAYIYGVPYYRRRRGIDPKSADEETTSEDSDTLDNQD
ncbi:MAG: DUF1616 domain-containing protein [Chloroflexi bacterium]|jgi:uncharacterized membrane protein|nr:DUF1616 domain-containing protein [Chloroflexota bacterium]MBT7081394.1 DUF1616 domain-containing protein [Chloroflexota bacterium]MBT7290424.1 DUF1616 domain-containing protein [Chloroflexota bacterium]